MTFRADEYFRASVERMRQARQIQTSGESYALGMYCAGLAVECMLRAFRWSKDASFEGRHDLKDLLKASNLLRLDEEHMRRQKVPDDAIAEYSMRLRAAMNEVVALWHNNLRFASEAALRAHLRKIDRLHAIRGNPLKKNAADLLNAAQTVIDRGVALWTSKKK